MISLILGLLSGVLITCGLSSKPSDNPVIFSFALIFILIISIYLLWKLWEGYNKNKAGRIDIKIKKEQLNTIKEKKDTKKDN